MVPIGETHCGEAPEPPHTTEVDVSDLDRCAGYPATHPRVAAEVARLRGRAITTHGSRS